MQLSNESAITDIKGIGLKQAENFSKLNIYSVKDLLFHIPFRYQDTSSVVTIAQFKSEGEGTFLAEIQSVTTTYYRKKITTVKVKDDTGNLTLTYFNQPYLKDTLKIGDVYLFNAKITNKSGRKNIYNPKFEKLKDEPENQLHLGKWIGIYPETKGLTSRTIRSKVKLLESDIHFLLDDPLQKEYISKLELTDLTSAIKKIHFPNSSNDIEEAKERLAFDEMLRIAIKLEEQLQKREDENSKGMKIVSSYLNAFIKSLTFKLTNDQNKAIEEILKDTTKTIPMNRLLNGDVGSGKTIVSATAILNTIKNGYSSILIAPTTVLAQQHYETFTNLFDGLEIGIDLCISTKKIIKKADNKLIIGTHAILYEKELPRDFNLVVIDEQHRFGVEQRQYFKKKTKLSPHYLTMTATPIPRSLTEIFFGGLDVSEIREKPRGRIEIKTYYTPYKKREDCFEWINKKIIESKYDNQAFVIYPLIEESEKLSAKAVLVEYKYLKKFFKDLNIQFLHGRLKEREKQQLLNDFKQKKINILVSTTVIEVGIDIPDATVMVIEDADRFGLAQLHQLRGRIGRSNKESYCFVIPNISVEKDSPAEKRLRYFAEHNSGFEVAEYDLKSRGPGEVYGTKQSGVPNFKVASINDLDLLKKARVVAKEILKQDNRTKYILENIFK
jgi:ATP-dependent DNA helicase RecG